MRNQKQTFTRRFEQRPHFRLTQGSTWIMGLRYSTVMLNVVSMVKLNSSNVPPTWIVSLPGLSGASIRYTPSSTASDVVPAVAPPTISAGNGADPNQRGSAQEAAQSSHAPP